MTKDLPQNRIQGALVVKNTSTAPISEEVFIDEQEETKMTISDFPENYFLTSLTDFCPKTVTIAFGEAFDDLKPMRFPFIKESAEVASGVRIAANIDFNGVDD